MIHKFFPAVKYWCTNKFFLWKHIFPIASWASDWLRTNSLSHWVWGFRFNIKIWILTLHRHPGDSALRLCCWCLETQTQNKSPIVLVYIPVVGHWDDSLSVSCLWGWGPEHHHIWYLNSKSCSRLCRNWWAWRQMGGVKCWHNSRHSSSFPWVICLLKYQVRYIMTEKEIKECFLLRVHLQVS